MTASVVGAGRSYSIAAACIAVPSREVVGVRRDWPRRAARAVAAARVRGGGPPGAGAPGSPPGSGAKGLQDREHPAVLAARVRQPELREDRRHVLLRAAERDVEAIGDGLVREPLGDELQHFALARREALERA